MDSVSSIFINDWASNKVAVKIPHQSDYFSKTSSCQWRFLSEHW